MVITHSALGVLAFPPAGSPKITNMLSPSDCERTRHLPTTNALARQEVTERKYEDDARDQQELGDRETPAVQCPAWKA